MRRALIASLAVALIGAGCQSGGSSATAHRPGFTSQGTTGTAATTTSTTLTPVELRADQIALALWNPFEPTSAANPYNPTAADEKAAAEYKTVNAAVVALENQATADPCTNTVAPLDLSCGANTPTGKAQAKATAANIAALKAAGYWYAPGVGWIYDGGNAAPGSVLNPGPPNPPSPPTTTQTPPCAFEGGC